MGDRPTNQSANQVTTPRLSREQRWGVASTVLASFFLGWAPILGKFAYRGGVTPFTLAAFRTVVAALFLWLVFILFGDARFLSRGVV